MERKPEPGMKQALTVEYKLTARCPDCQIDFSVLPHEAKRQVCECHKCGGFFYLDLCDSY